MSGAIISFNGLLLQAFKVILVGLKSRIQDSYYGLKMGSDEGFHQTPGVKSGSEERFLLTPA